MTNWQTEDQKPPLVKFHKIRCFTCAQDIPNKSELRGKKHHGHSVHYVNSAGEIDD